MSLSSWAIGDSKSEVDTSGSKTFRDSGDIAKILA